jgi:hypothetical protein
MLWNLYEESANLQGRLEILPRSMPSQIMSIRLDSMLYKIMNELIHNIEEWPRRTSPSHEIAIHFHPGTSSSDFVLCCRVLMYFVFHFWDFWFSFAFETIFQVFHSVSEKSQHHNFVSISRQFEVTFKNQSSFILFTFQIAEFPDSPTDRAEGKQMNFQIASITESSNESKVDSEWAFGFHFRSSQIDDRNLTSYALDEDIEIMGRYSIFVSSIESSIISRYLISKRNTSSEGRRLEMRPTCQDDSSHFLSNGADCSINSKCTNNPWIFRT